MDEGEQNSLDISLEGMTSFYTMMLMVGASQIGLPGIDRNPRDNEILWETPCSPTKVI
jgi:hypothetical protein